MTMHDPPGEDSRTGAPPVPAVVPAQPEDASQQLMPAAADLSAAPAPDAPVPSAPAPVQSAPPAGGLYGQPYGRTNYQPQPVQPHAGYQPHMGYQSQPGYQPYPPGPAAPAAAWPPAGWALPSAAGSGRTRRLRRVPLLLAVLGLLAGVAAGGLAVAQYQASRSPRQIVQNYFAALAHGRAADALGYAAVPPRGSYLTDAVLKQQLAAGALGKVHVDDVTVQGSEATADVDYTLGLHSGPRLVHDQLQLTKRGSGWKLQTVAPQVSVGVSSTGGDRVTLADAVLPDHSIYVFPGALPVDTDSSSLQVQGDPTVRIADDGQSVAITVGLTSSAKADLTRALTAALTSCLSGKSADANCPQVDDDRPVPGTLRGTVAPITSGISIALDSAGAGEIALTGQVSVKATWRVWDFNNQAVAKSGTTDLSVHAVASLANLETIYWSAS
ncbi:MAG TPA: hypothetical protein VHO01_07385 [Jatrophihabitans sp.]|nr:hypothetical protein [Jatrophihabitans sp.]